MVTAGEVICITGIGMATALGQDAATSCAAARAGLSRGRELEYFRVKSPVDGELSGVVGHVLPQATLGFEGKVRLLVLARIGLADLEREYGAGLAEDAPIRLYLVLPSADRVHKGIDQIADAMVRETRLGDAALARERQRKPDDGAWILKRIVEQVPLPIARGQSRAIQGGHCGVTTAVLQAARDLKEGRIERCLVGGVDTLVEESTLQWLLDAERLKCDGTPTGLQPGEAAAFLLLETAQAARARRAEILAIINAIGDDREPGCLFSGQPSTGAGISAAIRRTIAAAGTPPAAGLWLIVDQNGETYRAHEWGMALPRQAADAPDMPDSAVSYPAMAFGDIGAASGAVAICTVVRAFQRGYYPADAALVVSADDDINRTALHLSRH